MTDFERYGSDYEAQLAAATAFAWVEPAAYTVPKAEILLGLARERLGTERVRMLDVGCGPGLIHPYLARAATSLDACDVSTALLERARAAHPEVAYATTDGRRLPYDDDSFDLAFTICVLHHVPPPERADFARELARVVRPGGLAVVIEHNRWNPGTRHVVRTCSFDEDVILLPASETRELLASAGLRPEPARYFLLSPWRPAPVKRVERVVSRLPLGAQYALAAVA